MPKLKKTTTQKAALAQAKRLPRKQQDALYQRKLELVRKQYPAADDKKVRDLADRARVSALVDARAKRELEQKYRLNPRTKKWYPVVGGRRAKRGGITQKAFNAKRAGLSYWSHVHLVQEVTGSDLRTARKLAKRQRTFEKAYQKARKRMPGLERVDFRKKTGRDKELQALENVGVTPVKDTRPYRLKFFQKYGRWPTRNKPNKPRKQKARKGRKGKR